MKCQNLKIVHLTVYIKSMLTRFLKILNNMKSCTPLNVLTLNFNHTTDSIHFI
jgi:hypothetical protein